MQSERDEQELGEEPCYGIVGANLLGRLKFFYLANSNFALRKDPGDWIGKGPQGC
ncbi:hypothetical protein TRL7639_00067 [Falsiruegeria litorea R37]|uniref:Uncharacterized protein n=1 Tax=Falsiruegeria litorea R37 TaxID=1200284 RepID=A0A1Y5R8G3_9RHOB|nr:hypothetical protein TRL7639_00067 [Falsiruegeria litorea R37]